MYVSRLKTTLLPLALLLALFTSCRLKPKESLHWTPEYLAPMLQSRVGLEDVLTDTAVIRENGDHSLTVVYRDTVANLLLSEYVQVPDTQVSARVTLDSLSLSTDSIQRKITLEEMLTNLCQQGNVLACSLLTMPGAQIPFPLNLADQTTGEVPIDASQFFQEADLQSGELVVRVENHLPPGVDIDTAVFRLRNDGNYTNVVAEETMVDIQPGETETTVTDLSGQTVESQMAGLLHKLDLSAPGGFTVDLASYIMLTIKVQNMHASRATAIFPTQTVINDYSYVKYLFDNDIRVSKMSIHSGTLRVEAVSTIQDTLEFDYSLPTAKKNGQPVRVVSRLIPNGSTTTAQQDFDLAGYDVDLTLDGDSINMFPQHLLGRMFYSGNMNTMDLADFITVYYGLLDIRPSYIEGYLGKQEFSFQEEIPFDYLTSILGGKLDLEDPKVNLSFHNSIGVDGELKINYIKAVNSRTGEVVTLNAPFISQATAIPGPRLPNVGQDVSTILKLHTGNSNIRQFLSILPDKILFDMRVLANHNGNPALLNNFATDKSRIAAFMDIDMPLSMIGTDLVLQDMLDLDLTEAAVPKEVLDGKLRLVCENEFPFDAGVQFYFYNDAMSLVDSLFSTGPQVVPAGLIDQNGYVSVPAQGLLEAFFDQNKLTRLQSLATKAIVRFRLNTQPANTFVKLYTTYGIRFKLVGDFRYEIGA